MSYDPETGLGKCKDGKTIKPLPDESVLVGVDSYEITCGCGNIVRMELPANSPRPYHYWRTCECGREYFADINFRVKERGTERWVPVAHEMKK